MRLTVPSWQEYSKTTTVYLDGMIIEALEKNEGF